MITSLVFGPNASAEAKRWLSGRRGMLTLLGIAGIVALGLGWPFGGNRVIKEINLGILTSQAVEIGVLEDVIAAYDGDAIQEYNLASTWRLAKE
jgi:hypothetical protein